MKPKLSSFLKRVALYGWLWMLFIILVNEISGSSKVPLNSFWQVIAYAFGLIGACLALGLLGEGLYQLGKLVSREKE